MKLEVGKVYTAKSGGLVGIIAKAAVTPVAAGAPIPVQALAPYLGMSLAIPAEEYKGESAFSFFQGIDAIIPSWYNEDGCIYEEGVGAHNLIAEAPVLRKLGAYLSKENGYSAIITEHFFDDDNGIIHLVGRLYHNGKFVRIGSWKNDTGVAHRLGDPDLILED